MVNTVPVGDRESWPPILGLFKSVVIALTYSTFALCCELGGGDRSRGGWDVIVT